MHGLSQTSRQLRILNYKKVLVMCKFRINIFCSSNQKKVHVSCKNSKLLIKFLARTNARYCRAATRLAAGCTHVLVHDCMRIGDHAATRLRVDDTPAVAYIPWYLYCVTAPYIKPYVDYRMILEVYGTSTPGKTSSSLIRLGERSAPSPRKRASSCMSLSSGNARLAWLLLRCNLRLLPWLVLVWLLLRCSFRGSHR